MLMRAIYVEDSRKIVEFLQKGIFFFSLEGQFVNSDDLDDYIETDIDDNIGRKKKEMGKSMQFVFERLRFTTETDP